MFESQPLNDSPSPSSLMASSSSSSSRTSKIDVFASLHRPDVGETFLSNLRKAIKIDGITMFDGQGIDESQIIFSALTQAIKESRISIVVLSKDYASSSLRLHELLEILNCKENIGQIVKMVFYGDSSDRDSLIAFNETCAPKTEEERRRWTQALNDVGNIPEKDFINSDNESKMIEEIARDISNRLKKVGLVRHLILKIRSLLHNEGAAAMIVGICGPAGKHRCSTGMAFLVVTNLLLEIASAVVEHLPSIGKPYLARISVVMSFLSVVLSILDLIYKIRDHKASFRCNCPIPWFYHTKPAYNNRIFGNFTDTVLLFCAVGGFIVSTVNWIFIEKRREGPIKASVWPLFFAIGLFGMVVYKFIQEKRVISKDNKEEKKESVESHSHVPIDPDKTPKQLTHYMRRVYPVMQERV